MSMSGPLKPKSVVSCQATCTVPSAPTANEERSEGPVLSVESTAVKSPHDEAAINCELKGGGDAVSAELARYVFIPKDITRRIAIVPAAIVVVRFVLFNVSLSYIFV